MKKVHQITEMFWSAISISANSLHMLTKIYATKERSPNLGNFFRTIIPRHKLWCRIHIIIMKSLQYVFRLSINFNTIFTSIPFVTYNKQLWYICYIPPRSTCFIAARRLNDEKTIFLEGRDKLVINTVPITVLGYNTPSWSVTKKKKQTQRNTFRTSYLWITSSHLTEWESHSQCCNYP